MTSYKDTRETFLIETIADYNELFNSGAAVKVWGRELYVYIEQTRDRQHNDCSAPKGWPPIPVERARQAWKALIVAVGRDKARKLAAGISC